MSTLDGPLSPTPSGPVLDLRVPALAQRPRVSAAVAGRLGLAAILGSALLLCLAAARTDVLLPESLQPPTGPLVGAFSPISFHLQSGEVIGALVLMFIGYVTCVRHAERLSPRLLFGAVGVFLVVVTLAPPLFSTDVFSYQEYARLFFGLHANPYTNNNSLLSAVHDNLSGYVSSTWIATPTVYGPLFTLFSGIFENTGRLGSTGAIALSVYAYKVLAALSCVGTMWILWHSAQRRGVSPVRAMALFGLNPLIVLYGVGGGHNDLVMMLFATAGIWAMLDRRPRASGALIVVSAAIKLTGGLFLPFAIIAPSDGGTPGRWRQIAFGAAVALVISVGVGLAVFGTGMGNMIHTLRTVQGVGGWQNVPGFFSTVLGWQQMSHIISTLFGVCFALISCRLLWRVYHNDLDWLTAAGWSAFWLLVATSSIQPWYICWLIVPLALCSSRRMWLATAWLTGWLELTQIVGYLPHAPNILGI